MKLTVTNFLPRVRARLSQEDMESLFSKLENPEHWKLPISATIPKKEYENYNEACIHFTGGKLVITRENGDRCDVVSEGYYHHIGS